MIKVSCIIMSNHKILCVHKFFYTKPWNLQFKTNLKFKKKNSWQIWTLDTFTTCTIDYHYGENGQFIIDFLIATNI
jgi:hypothetical protein